MNDKLREAADYIPPVRYGTDEHATHGGMSITGSLPNGVWDVLHDLIQRHKLLADAYLAEHPEDDDAKLTESWERINCDRVTANGEFVFSATATIDVLHNPGNDQWYISDDLPNVTCIKPLETRGQLRWLLAALGGTGG